MISRLEDRYFDAILWIAKNIRARYVAALTLLSWPGVALILPVVFRWDTAWLINANLYGTLIAASLVIGWLVVQLQARDRRHLLEWAGDLRLLDGQEFEWFVGELFRREGWTVEERGRQDAADGNVDLELVRGSERRLVQCKRWTAKWIGVDEIRQFVGTLTREKLPSEAGMFVTLSSFTEQALAEAKAAGLELLDKADLMQRVDKVRRVEACPNCRAAMVLDHSAHGWWFRCKTPGCGGKRHLDRDPGRAVALLTEQQ